jgi:hypothetical protein
VEKKRSQRGSNPRNCLGKSHLRRRGCERKRTETHQGDRVTVNMVQLDDPGGVACKKRQRDLESVSFRHLGRVEFCSDLHSTLKQLDCSEWASRISTNLGLYSCESLIGFSEALNSCTYIYDPNRRVLSSGGYRELPRWVFAYVALVGMLCRAPRADHFKATTRSP